LSLLGSQSVEQLRPFPDVLGCLAYAFRGGRVSEMKMRHLNDFVERAYWLRFSPSVDS
jgi:hypothetical protein